MEKKIYKSKNKKIDGVCGGIAEYFSVDPTVIRLLWVLISLFTAAAGGVIAYAVCCIVIPNAPESIEATQEAAETEGE